QEVTNVRAGTTGQVQVAVASVTEQLMQASDTQALCPVVDICTHQVIVPGQVRVYGIGGHWKASAGLTGSPLAISSCRAGTEQRAGVSRVAYGTDIICGLVALHPS